MWQLATWFSGELGSPYLTVGLHELKGLFHPKWLYDACFPCWRRTTCAMMTARLSLENRNHQYSYSSDFPITKLPSFALCCTFTLALWILTSLLESEENQKDFLLFLVHILAVKLLPQCRKLGLDFQMQKNNPAPSQYEQQVCEHSYCIKGGTAATPLGLAMLSAMDEFSEEIQPATICYNIGMFYKCLLGQDSQQT